MGEFKKESLGWLDRLAQLEIEVIKAPNANYAVLAKTLGISKGNLGNLMLIRAILDPEAIDKIRRAALSHKQQALPESASQPVAVTQEVEAHPGYILSLNCALALTKLKGNVPDLPKAVHEVLDEVISHRFRTKQISNLVAWVISGKSAKDFDPSHTQSITKAGDHPNPGSETPNLTSPGVNEPEIKDSNDLPEENIAEEQEVNRTHKLPQGKGTTLGQKLDAFLNQFKSIPSKRKKTVKQTSKKSKVKSKNLNRVLITGFREGFQYLHRYIKEVGKSVAHRLVGKSKKRRGANPLKSLAYWFIYGFTIFAVYSTLLGFITHFIPIIGPLLDGLIGSGFNLLGRLFLLALGYTLRNTWAAVVLGLLLLRLIYKVFRPGIFQIIIIGALLVAVWWFKSLWIGYFPTRLALGKSEQPKVTEASSPTPVISIPITNPTPVKPVSRGNKKKLTSKSLPRSSYSVAPSAATVPESPKANLESNPVPSGPMPWDSSLEDRTNLEDEIACLPQPFHIKNCDIQPDPAITLDMADRRLADMQDSEKYTVFWGHDRQRLQSASPNPSGLSLGFAGTFGNLLGDNSKCEFYWEDVKAIHCSQIDVASNAPKGFYQCTLLVSGLKRPLTFQSSADGIRHLVSAVEFKIRSTTGGKNAPIAGIPYLFLGFWLDRGNQVDGLWENSPASQTKVNLGDRIGELGKTRVIRRIGKNCRRPFKALPRGSIHCITSGKRIGKRRSRTSPIPKAGP